MSLALLRLEGVAAPVLQIDALYAAQTVALVATRLQRLSVGYERVVAVALPTRLHLVEESLVFHLQA